MRNLLIFLAVLSVLCIFAAAQRRTTRPTRSTSTRAPTRSTPRQPTRPRNPTPTRRPTRQPTRQPTRPQQPRRPDPRFNNRPRPGTPQRFPQNRGPVGSPQPPQTRAQKAQVIAQQRQALVQQQVQMQQQRMAMQQAMAQKQQMMMQQRQMLAQQVASQRGMSLPFFAQTPQQQQMLQRQQLQQQVMSQRGIPMMAQQQQQMMFRSMQQQQQQSQARMSPQQAAMIRQQQMAAQQQMMRPMGLMSQPPIPQPRPPQLQVDPSVFNHNAGQVTGGRAPQLTLQPGQRLNRQQTRDVLLRAMRDAGITDPRAQANILANVEVESRMQPIVESMNYSPEGLRKVFPKYFPTTAIARQYGRIPGRPAREEAIADRVYGGRMGNARDEGWDFRGRGYIQLTGRDNYSKYGQRIGVDLVRNPELAAHPEYAARLATEYFRGLPANKLRDINQVIDHVGPADRSSFPERRRLADQWYREINGLN